MYGKLPRPAARRIRRRCPGSPAAPDDAAAFWALCGFFQEEHDETGSDRRSMYSNPDELAAFMAKVAAFGFCEMVFSGNSQEPFLRTRNDSVIGRFLRPVNG